MSGGRFDYKQYPLNDIAEQIEYELKHMDAWLQYEKFTVEEKVALENNMEGLIHLLKFCQVGVQRLDWLLSGDDGLQTYFERLEEDRTKLRDELEKKEYK